MTLALRDRAYARDHERSQEARLSKGIMPKTLPSLLHWFLAELHDETPEALHRPGVWRDYGDQAEGGSQLGSPAYADPFRRLLENAPSETDIDGYYLRPMRAAMSRIGRRKPLMARNLAAVAMASDWRTVAECGGWPTEMYEDYLFKALCNLWREYAEQVVRLA